MREPSQEQLDTLKALLRSAFAKLQQHDSDIYSSTTNEADVSYSDIYKIVDRKLHEVTINHRLAHYLENSLTEFSLFGYLVDIEYNRFYQNEKLLRTTEGIKVVRPDIIIHSRRNFEHDIQHYLVIEAKKDKPSNNDIEKVKSLLNDERYNYMFGATVSYANPEGIVCVIYYAIGAQIVAERLTF